MHSKLKEVAGCIGVKGKQRKEWQAWKVGVLKKTDIIFLWTNFDRGQRQNIGMKKACAEDLAGRRWRGFPHVWTETSKSVYVWDPVEDVCFKVYMFS